MILATFFFTIQIYCDFSGYSDIAVGLGKLFGIRLTDNFEVPYFSKTIKEFWSRWHISLSTWLRDYVYIFMGGNRRGIWRKNINLMVTFLVSGLWHGAGAQYLAWGGIHGCYQIIGNLLSGKKAKDDGGAKRVIKITATFIMVSFAWIFFRANSLSDAFYVVGHMFDGIGNWAGYCNDFKTAFIVQRTGLFILAGEILVLFCHDLCSCNAFLVRKVDMFCGKHPFLVRVLYVALVLCILALCPKRTEAPFIYVQF